MLGREGEEMNQTLATGDAMTEKSGELCLHCHAPKVERNPTGTCDHLYWPDFLTDEAKIANGYRQVQVTVWTKGDRSDEPTSQRVLTVNETSSKLFRIRRHIELDALKRADQDRDQWTKYPKERDDEVPALSKRFGPGERQAAQP